MVKPCAKCNRSMADHQRVFRCTQCKSYFCPSCMDRFCLLCKGQVQELQLG